MMTRLIADSQIIPGLVGAVAGTLFLSAVRLVPWMRFVPPDNPDISFEELREKYSATYLLQAAALFVITPLICCVMAWGTFVLFDCVIPSTSDDLYIGRFPGIAVLLHVIPLSIILSSIPVWGLTHWILGAKRTQELCLYSEWATGVRQAPLAAAIVISALAFAIPLTWLEADCWVRIKPDRIEVNEFLTLGTKSWAYSDVRRLVEVRSRKSLNGNIGRRIRARIVMSDGTDFDIESFPVAYYRKGEYAATPLFEKAPARKLREATINAEILAVIHKATGIPIEIEDPYPEEENVIAESKRK